MNTKLKNTLLGGVFAVAMIGFAGSASATMTWTVNDAASAGVGYTDSYDVSSLSFTYDSTVSQIIAGGDGFDGDDDFFTESGTAHANSYSPTPSFPVLSGLNDCNSVAQCGYGINATFLGHGEADLVAGNIIAGFSDFTVQFFFDDDPTDANGYYGQDVQFAEASLSGPAVVKLLNVADANGDFSIKLDVSMLAGFEDYWFPSQLMMTLAGNVDQDNTLPQDLVDQVDSPDGSPYTFSFTEATANLKRVPEPSVLGLMGLGLIGLGLMRRRRKA